MPHATVSRCLERRLLSRRPTPAKEEVRRFEWPCPGDLLQMDTKRFARFSTPGHAVTGDRSRSGAERRERVGYEFAHSILDDHSRLAYTELHQGRARPDRHRLRRARARLLRLARDRAQAAADRPTPGSTPRTANSRRCSPSEGSDTARSRPARRRATARSSATSRRSSASGVSASATAHRGTARWPCHTGSSTTTTPGDTQRSGTAHPSAAFGTSQGRTASRAQLLPAASRPEGGGLRADTHSS